MTDPYEGDLWQRRFERLGSLVLLAAIATPFALASQAYVVQRTTASTSAEGFDWIAVLREFGRSAGPATGALVLAAFLLVAWGPGDRLSLTGTRVLQATVVVGLVLSVAAGFSALDVLFTGQGVAAFGGATGDDPAVFTELVARVGATVPLIAGGALAGLGAWFAFSTLGEVPVEPGEPAGAEALE